MLKRSAFCREKRGKSKVSAILEEKWMCVLSFRRAGCGGTDLPKGIHLGKLITYASGKAADVIIWVVKRPREEHKAAIEWLNNHTDEKIGFSSAR